MGIKKLLFLFFFSLTIFVRPVAASSIISTGSVLSIGALIGGVIGGVISYAFRPDENESDDKTTSSIVLTGNDVRFSEPGSKILELTNFSSEPITVDNISLNGVHEISKGSLIDCQPMAAHGKCSITLTANENAYGYGGVVITYSNAGTNGTIMISAIVVDNVELDLYKCKKRTDECKEDDAIPDSECYCEEWEEKKPMALDEEIMLEKEKSPLFFKYTNRGKFIWLKKDGENEYISWEKEFPPGAITLQEDTTTAHGSQCGSSSIDIDESCIFTLTSSDDKDHPGAVGILKITGENIGVEGEITKNVLGSGGLEIVMNNQNTSDLHLEYRSLKVVSTVKGTNPVKITTLDAESNKATKIKYCPPNDNDCYYETTCVENSTELSHGEHCLVWFKALDNKPFEKDEEVLLAVEVQGEYDKGGKTVEVGPEEDTFKATYENTLYACCRKPTTITSVLKLLGGTSWSILREEPNNSIKALTIANGDLYVGSYYDSVIRWMGGSLWESLGGLNNTIINSLAVASDGSIYAGTNLGVYKYLKGIWDKLGNYIGTLAIDNDDYLYVGANGVYKWGGVAWSSLGFPVPVTALAIDSGDNLYAGDSSGVHKHIGGASWDHIGSIGSIFEITFINNEIYAGGSSGVHKWLGGASWNNLGQPPDNATVTTLAVSNDDLYVGTDSGGVYKILWDDSWDNLGSTGCSRITALTAGASILITTHESKNP